MISSKLSPKYGSIENAPSKLSTNYGYIMDRHKNTQFGPKPDLNFSAKCSFDTQENSPKAKSFGPCQPGRTAQADMSR